MTRTERGFLVRYLVVVGRVLFSAIFLMTILGHFSQGYVGYAAQQGVPAAGLLVPLSGIIAIAGGLSIALGYKAKIGAWLIVIFLVPVTFTMHNFWAIQDPMQKIGEMVNFTKNMALIGCALMFLAIPQPWPHSLGY